MLSDCELRFRFIQTEIPPDLGATKSTNSKGFVADVEESIGDPY